MREPLSDGALIRQWRKDHGLRVKDLAALTGIERSHLGRIESGLIAKMGVREHYLARFPAGLRKHLIEGRIRRLQAMLEDA